MTNPYTWMVIKQDRQCASEQEIVGFSSDFDKASQMARTEAHRNANYLVKIYEAKAEVVMTATVKYIE